MSDAFGGSQDDEERAKREILAHIERQGIVHKDHGASVPKGLKWKGKKTSSNRANRTTLDLHGLTSDQAEQRIRSTLVRLQEQGNRELLIIHGIGYHSSQEPVLKNLVRLLLEGDLSNYIRDFRTGLPREGGDGVTIVYLR